MSSSVHPRKRTHTQALSANDSVDDVSTNDACTSSHEENDDDYMSDALLAQLNDVRPGVQTSLAAVREQKVAKGRTLAREVQLAKPKRGQVEKEKRNEALSTPIGAETKGFALMAKMGYRPGMSLGRSQSSSALLEPLRPDLKADRSGFGHESAQKEKAVRLLEAHRQQMVHRQATQQRLLGDYKAQKRDEQQQKRVQSDYRRSQNVCQQLDLGVDADMQQPAEHWFWPKYRTSAAASVDEDTLLDVYKYGNGQLASAVDEEEGFPVDYASRLAFLTNYLRATHHYCIWCGTKFENEGDMQQSCPGATKEEHDDEEL